MARPRLLLVPTECEIEWLIKPELEEWADVASYDAPGVGAEPPAASIGPEAVADRGLTELERREWNSCVVVADEFGIAAAALLATSRPEAVQGLALGHARLSNELGGDRPAMNREVFAAMGQLMQTDYRSAVRQFAGLTGGERGSGGYADEWTQRYLERVPKEIVTEFWEAQPGGGREIGEKLRALRCPFLLAGHRDCLLFTKESFEDAVAAFPDAPTIEVSDKPSASPDFADALRSWCEEIGA